MAGIKDSFMGSSLFSKLAFVFLLVSNLCNFIAFTTAEWGKRYTTPTGNNYVGYGLWRSCPHGEPVSSCGSLDGVRVDWYGGTQAFAILGFVGINVAFLIVILQIFTSCCKSVGDLTFWNAILCIVTAICYLIAVIIFGANFDKTYNTSGQDPDLGFSFGLAIVALFLEIVAGVVLILEGKKGGGTTSPS